MSDEQQEQTVRRVVPQNALDWNAMTTDTMWGSPFVSQQIANQIKERSENKTEQRSGGYGLLNIYTRDFRLANTSLLRGDEEHCEHYSNLSTDLATEGMSESFSIALSRVACRLELSQSRGGFFRRRQNTITSESMTGELDKKRKMLSFGGKQ